MLDASSITDILTHPTITNQTSPHFAEACARGEGRVGTVHSTVLYLPQEPRAGDRHDVMRTFPDAANQLRDQKLVDPALSRSRRLTVANSSRSKPT